MDMDLNPDRLRTRPYSPAEIAGHALFLPIEREIASHLIGIHLENPRAARLAASHQKWLMTQSLYALHLERRPDDPLSGLTRSRLLEIVAEYQSASRNTAIAFLAELLSYKFLEEVPDVPDRRVRVLRTTSTSDWAMRSWFEGHMRCLDRLDDGNRLNVCRREARIFPIAQPRAARSLIADSRWRMPGACIGHFLWSDVGGLLLHELVSRLPDTAAIDERIILENVSIGALAEKYAISATNAKRMFKKAEADGVLGWEAPRRDMRLWLSRGFLDSYFAWQSVKFAALDEAFHWACAQLRCA
ncbi:hypothetical protein MRS76_18125 [Rhizobiaceae bacterium n13]|uniref:Uncharacterized protein n=1 Tax=Ferirhizobium litorale TaxID=2927786 RepID=A0AAE3QFP4_9HYPH|nr:hypothetical protein [Fererhizobium litorale]MDI7863873.1 hypothetical protein [Fererhizobium litorale]MDI7924295.1 hypothetical protein [Fererhizobium litorale]